MVVNQLPKGETKRLSEDIDLDNTFGIDMSTLETDLLTYYRSNIGYAEVTAKTQQGEWGIRRTILKFPILYGLGLTSHANEPLHLKVEVRQHKQISILRKTPVLIHGRSFVAVHFSLETMWPGRCWLVWSESFKRVVMEFRS